MPRGTGTPIATGPLACQWMLAYSGGVADASRALADPTRRIILEEPTLRNGQIMFALRTRLITNHGPTSSRQSVSQCRDFLEGACLVDTRREAVQHPLQQNSPVGSHHGPMGHSIHEGLRWVPKQRRHHEK